MLEDQVKQILRRLENIEKTQAIQFKERDILEDILLKIDSLKGVVNTLQQEVKLLKERIDKYGKNNQADIADVIEKVDNTKESLNEIKETITS